MKLFLLSIGATLGSAAGLVKIGVLPCPCEVVSSWTADAQQEGSEVSPATVPAGLYLEARDATVWGGACHVSSQADTHGSHAVLGWSIASGSFGGEDLTGVRVVAAVEGSANLQAHEVFGSGEAPDVTSVLWIHAANAAQRDAAAAYVAVAADLGHVAATHNAIVQVERTGDAFELSVNGVLQVEGDAIADRACCTMPESRWYEPLSSARAAIVGNPLTCRFEGANDLLEPWTFEGENSAFVATFGATAIDGDPVVSALDAN